MKVRYNGGTDYYTMCSNPSKLDPRKIYTVSWMDVQDWQTKLVLKGVNGTFDALWFDEVPSNDRTYMAFTRKVPSVREQMVCKRLDLADSISSDIFVDIQTSPVKSISRLRVNSNSYVYRVTTYSGSIYIVTLV